MKKVLGGILKSDRERYHYRKFGFHLNAHSESWRFFRGEAENDVAHFARILAKIMYLLSGICS